MSASRISAARATALAAAILLGGCAGGQPESSYFDVEAPTQVALPAVTGDPVYVGVMVVHSPPTIRVTIDGAEALGVSGNADVEPLAAIVGAGMNFIGIGTAADVAAADIDLTAYKPLPVSFAVADGQVALIMKLTTSDPVAYFRHVRVRFHLDDGKAMYQTVPLSAMVCTAATRDAASLLCDQAFPSIKD